MVVSTSLLGWFFNESVLVLMVSVGGLVCGFWIESCLTGRRAGVRKGRSTWPKPTCEAMSNKEQKTIRITTSTAPRLIHRGLAFSEKFTTLYKVIANTPDIGKPVNNIGTKLQLKAITLLNLNSGSLPIQAV